MINFILRSISLFVGVLTVYLLFTDIGTSTPSIIEFTLRLVISITFIVYGVGGQKLLSKIPLLNFFSKPMKLSLKKTRVNSNITRP